MNYYSTYADAVRFYVGDSMSMKSMYMLITFAVSASENVIIYLLIIVEISR